MILKERLTVTVDSHLIEAGNVAVASGQADSLSGWVNLALAERVAKERRLAAMEEAIAAYEERFGEISAREMAEQARTDRQRAIVIRDGFPKPKRTRRSRRL